MATKRTVENLLYDISNIQTNIKKFYSTFYDGLGLLEDGKSIQSFRMLKKALGEFDNIDKEFKNLKTKTEIIAIGDK